MRARLLLAAKIVPDGNPQKLSWMGTLSGIGHPSFCPSFHDGNLIGHALGDRDQRAS